MSLFVGLVLFYSGTRTPDATHIVATQAKWAVRYLTPMANTFWWASLIAFWVSMAGVFVAAITAKITTPSQEP